MLDLNNADQQRQFELIPNKTIVPVIMSIRPGGHGETGELTLSKSSDAVYVSAEFTVISGLYQNRKIFDNIGIGGGKCDDAGNSIYGNMGRTRMRAILEAARNIKPDDFSQEAVKKRQIDCYSDFNGMAFLAEIRISKGKDGYEDKNSIKQIITPDHKLYQKIDADGYIPPQNDYVPVQTVGTSAGPVSTPDWAK